MGRQEPRAAQQGEVQRPAPREHSPLHRDMLGCQPESSSTGKDLVDKLNVSQQPALAAKQANSLPGCIRQNTASKPRAVTLPPRSALTRQTWTYWSPAQGHTDHQCTGASDIPAGLRELGLFSPGKSRLRGIPSMCTNTCREGAKRTEPGSFQWCPGGQALEQVSQRGCEVSILGDTHCLTGHGPGQPAAADAALSRELELMSNCKRQYVSSAFGRDFHGEVCSLTTGIARLLLKTNG
ncbi:hypothetical protein QYF61_027957 [Mycteria americana]|uniref:Uncharacterized protein n=1 Tax=Mycteria americana TaxID=33587 RepID=A0AAN7N9A4_MYCAM|nr:hypothetical protein QYF61_027957 [Mycteria americana]